MSSYPIPSEALDDRLGIVGTSGAGKTYAAGSAVEKVLHRRSRVIIFDPLDVWWGLRLRADGKSDGFPVVIIGGAHADLPINAHAGALIGETIAKTSESCIASTASLGRKADERRFMLDCLEALYKHATGEPVHLIFDEADLWAPQKILDKEGNATKLQGQMEMIVRRGRVKGFIPWLITQRPAVLSKDVLSQADGLVAMKLTASQDRKALGAWIEGMADVEVGKRISAELPAKQRGEAVVWIPARGVLTEATFPEKITFDSSSTPKRGAKRKSAATLKPLDIASLKERLSSVEAEAKANDPNALRAEIASLRKQLAKAPTEQNAIDPHALAAAERRGYERGITAAADHIRGAHLYWTPRLAVRNKETKFETGDRHPIGDMFAADIMALLGKRMPRAADAPSRPILAPPAAPRPMNGERSPAASLPGDIGAERRPLAVLASAYPAGMTEAQWAVAAGMKRTGGTFQTYKSRLRTAGRIESRDGQWFASEDALMLLGADIPTMPPPGPDLVTFWAEKIGGVGPMLKALEAAYPAGYTRDDLAADLSMAAGGGTFNTYLSRLRSAGLLEPRSDKQVRLAPALMGFDA